MTFVVDASLAACWLLPDEADPRATAAYARFPDDHAIVPGLWWFEMRNIFIVAERRGRIDTLRADLALAVLAELPITLDHEADDAVLMGLARRHRLTAYDAAYLELAMRLGAPIGSLDRQLIAAARAERVDVIGD